MNNLDIYGKKEPEASGYSYVTPTPDIWTWDGFKKFGWWQYPKQILSVISTIFIYGFFAGLILALIIGFLLPNKV